MTDPRELQKRFGVADAHADSLMWNRDLNLHSQSGHVDFPRLRQAGVRLQCFTIVTRGFPVIGGFPVLAWWNDWPKEARRSEWTRAVYQLEQLRRFCAASGGQVDVADSRASLERILAADQLCAIAGVEGAHALEGRVDRVRELWRRGVRFMSLTHLSNNELGGSSYPFMPEKGLTPHGQDVLDEMARIGMPVDVAHASKKTLEDLLAHPTARPMCSHTGAKAQGGGWRNLDDATLKRIADRGGVVGIIFATIYVGGRHADDVARHILHALDVMGEDGVALGSDFDGMIPLPKGMRDVRDLHVLTAALQKRGLPENRIEKVLFGNWRRFFSETLDGSGSA